MIHAQINNRPFFTFKEISILEACKFIGIKIPRFCYHENLSIAGNCRMCLVEVAKVAKPVASCAAFIEDNMIINTTSPMVLKARTNVLEVLLLNHPLDCPICDQGGECDLQDQAKLFGNSKGRQYFNKRGVEDKYFGPLIKTIMTRCIHCTRCVRFTTEICGTKFLGVLGRGNNAEIGNYTNKIMFTGILSNVVDLCPVGALTFKPSSFQTRSWEVKSLESIDLMDGLGSNIYINYKELDIIRVMPKKNIKINESWISDKARFGLTNSFLNINSKVDVQSIFANISLNKRILCLVNHEVNLELLNKLQQIAYLSKNSIKVKHFLIDSNKSNYYFWSNYNKVQDISLNNASQNVYIFISSNLNIESTLLNTRIRANYLAKYNYIYSYGNFFKSTYPLFCLKLQIQNLVNIFSAKDYLITKLFLINQVFIFYGKSLSNRIDSKLIYFLKNKIPTLKEYKINTYCNTESINYLNISSYNNNDFKNYDYIFNFFLEDTIFFRKKSLFYSNKMYWFNNFNSKISSYLNFIYLNDSNKEGIFLSLEQRPQKAVKLVNFFNFKDSFKYFINVFKDYYLNNSFEIIRNKNYTSLNRVNILKVFFEILANVELFDKITKNILDNNMIVSSKLHLFYTNYPFKLIINDYFRTNLASKNSIVLLKCSKLNRKLLNTNFN